MMMNKLNVILISNFLFSCVNFFMARNKCKRLRTQSVEFNSDGPIGGCIPVAHFFTVAERKNQRSHWHLTKQGEYLTFSHRLLFWLGRCRAVSCITASLVLLACHSAPPPVVPKPPVSFWKPPQLIKSYSETQPYTALAIYQDMLYAGTPTGIIRFNQRTGHYTRISREQGLAGRNVYALSGNPTSGLWAATEEGICRFYENKWTTIDTSQSPIEVGTALLATEKGLWAGGPHGLAYYQDDKWQGLIRGARITSLLLDISGKGVWAGTDGEGIYSYLDGQLTSHSQAQGQMLRTVKGLAYTSDGGIFAIGKNNTDERLAFYDGTYWTTYDVYPKGKLQWVQRVGNETIVAYEDRLFSLRRMPPEADRAQGKIQTAGPIKLIAFKPRPRYPIPAFIAAPITQGLPVASAGILGHDRKVYLGTRWMGVAVFDGKQVNWFRTNDLSGDNTHLKIACTSTNCYLAGGEGRGFRYYGNGFEPIMVDSEPGAKIHAFINDQAGAVLALHSPADQAALMVSILNSEGRFTKLYEKKITIPSGTINVRFVRIDPAGRLWVGLGYYDEEHDRRSWGMAILSKDEPVLYHRSTLLPTEDRGEGSLALADDVRNVEFVGDEAWIATNAGIYHIRGKKLQIFSENEGLESEIIYGVTHTPRGDLVIASYGGIGRFDGHTWRFDFKELLKNPIYTLLPMYNLMCIGTAQGLVYWEDEKNQIIDVQKGLAGNIVWDLYHDKAANRLWTLTDKGVSVLSF